MKPKVPALEGMRGLEGAFKRKLVNYSPTWLQLLILNRIAGVSVNTTQLRSNGGCLGGQSIASGDVQCSARVRWTWQIVLQWCRLDSQLCSCSVDKRELKL